MSVTVIMCKTVKFIVEFNERDEEIASASDGDLEEWAGDDIASYMDQYATKSMVRHSVEATLCTHIIREA